MAIYLGNSTPEKFYLGSAEVEKIYLGSSEIWSKSKLPNWYQDGWQDLLGPDSWYERWQVIVAAATTPTSGAVPNCTVVYGSFQDYYEYNNSAINIQLRGSGLSFTRVNDWKKRKFVTYDSNTRTWGTVTSEANSGFFAINNIVQNIPVRAFIIFTTPNYPGGYNTNIPYQGDL